MNTGGPAFPVPDTYHHNGQVQFGSNGMTLLDWYAGQALAGLCSSWYDRHKDDPETQRGHGPTLISQSAYTHAEAMLAEKARREAVVQESSTTDHSPDAGKMAELEAANTMLKREIERLRTELCETVDSWAKLKIANSELVEALEGCLENLERWCPVKHREARDILSKHKGVA